jgi:hypothetical protein
MRTAGGNDGAPGSPIATNEPPARSLRVCHHDERAAATAQCRKRHARGERTAGSWGRDAGGGTTYAPGATSAADRVMPTAGGAWHGTSMATQRERIDNHGSAQYIRRDAQGRFTKDQSDVGRSSARDQQQHSKTQPKRGQGDRGDRPDS